MSQLTPDNFHPDDILRQHVQHALKSLDPKARRDEELLYYRSQTMSMAECCTRLKGAARDSAQLRRMGIDPSDPHEVSSVSALVQCVNYLRGMGCDTPLPNTEIIDALVLNLRWLHEQGVSPTPERIREISELVKDVKLAQDNLLLP